MCVYSMIADHFIDKWQPRYEPPAQFMPLVFPPPVEINQLTDEEVAELRKLLERAKEYDRRTGQPECELEEKKETLRKLARQLGVEIELP